MGILNLTQHEVSAEQIEQGVVSLSEFDREYVKIQLTFNIIPSSDDIRNRAERIARTAKAYNVSKAMIGGAPYLMSALEKALKGYGITPVYAFSVRNSTEKIQEDGSIQKVATFLHTGFIEV